MKCGVRACAWVELRVSHVECVRLESPVSQANPICCSLNYFYFKITISPNSLSDLVFWYTSNFCVVMKTLPTTPEINVMPYLPVRPVSGIRVWFKYNS